MKHNGFMLMEFLVYLAIFSIIMLALSGMVEKLWIPAMTCTKKQTCCIDLATAYDCFTRDVRIAKAEKIFWKQSSPDALIFKSGWRDIGWLRKNGDLVRIAGDFNQKDNVWNKQATSLIVRKIDEISFAIKGDPQIRSVFFKFGKNGEQVASEVALINGIVPWKIKKP